MTGVDSIDDGSMGRRLVIGGVVIVMLLLSALAATTVSAAREQDRRRELRRTVDLLAETGRMRFIVGQLGSAQAAVALDVVRSLPGAMSESNPHRLTVERGLQQSRDQLAIIDDEVTTASQRSRVDQVVVVLDAFTIFDNTVAADYASGNAALHQRARAAVLSAQVERYQELADAVIGLDSLVTELSLKLSTDIADADSRARTLHVVITAVLIAAVAALAVWMSQANRERRRLTDRLQLEADRDHLTGIANRRRWERGLDQALRDARHENRSLSVVLIDLDHFKRYNDTFGHLAGDEHLRQVAAGIAALVGSRDSVARLGGEEFGLLQPGHSPEQAALVVERLRPAIPHGQTFSAGIARWEPHESPLEVMARADLALYRAKEHGRNRVAIAA